MFKISCKIRVLIQKSLHCFACVPQNKIVCTHLCEECEKIKDVILHFVTHEQILSLTTTQHNSSQFFCDGHPCRMTVAIVNYMELFSLKKSTYFFVCFETSWDNNDFFESDFLEIFIGCFSMTSTKILDSNTSAQISMLI